MTFNSILCGKSRKCDLSDLSRTKLISNILSITKIASSHTHITNNTISLFLRNYSESIIQHINNLSIIKNLN